MQGAQAPNDCLILIWQKPEQNLNIWQIFLGCTEGFCSPGYVQQCKVAE